MDAQPCRRGFTLVELLVVVAIIGLLLAIMAPALSKARSIATEAVCASNLHQIGIACLTYETGNRRLPPSVDELSARFGSYSPSYPNTIRNGSDDIREIFEPYMDVDNFNCPFVPSWRPSQATESVINVEYYVGGGYWGSGSGSRYRSRWIKTTDTPEFDGRPITTLAGDRLYIDYNKDWSFINHAKGGAGFALVSSSDPRPRGYGWRKDNIGGVDERDQYDGNFVFMDGSSGRYSGGDATMVDLPTRHNNDMWFLVPSMP